MGDDQSEVQSLLTDLKSYTEEHQIKINSEK